MENATETVSQAAESIQETAHATIPAQLREPEWGGVILLDLGLALAVIVGTVLIRWFVLWILERTLGRFIRCRTSEFGQCIWDSSLRIFGFAILLAGLFFAFSMLDLPGKPTDWAGGIWRFYNSLLIVFAATLVYRTLDAVLRFGGRPLSAAAAERDTGMLRKELLPLARDLVKIALVIVSVILIVQSWGYSATALLAGVGLGGLALAFAAQDTVANVFGSLVVYTDRPFRTGDWVQIGGIEGVVEEIGIRSTRIRKFDRSMVSVPNKSVTAESIHNYSAMHQRRIRFHVRLDPTTPPERIEAALSAIRELVNTNPKLVKEFWVVNLESLSPASLDVLVYCFTPEIDWREYLQIQEDLILSIMRQLAELQVALAQPLYAPQQPC